MVFVGWLWLTSRWRDLQVFPRWVGTACLDPMEMTSVFLGGRYMGSITPRIALNFNGRWRCCLSNCRLFWTKVHLVKHHLKWSLSNPTRGMFGPFSKTHNMRGLGLLEVNLHQTCLTAIFTARWTWMMIRPEVIVVSLGVLNFEPSHVR